MASELSANRLAAATALKAKRGQTSPRALTGLARQMYERNSVSELSQITQRRR